MWLANQLLHELFVICIKRYLAYGFSNHKSMTKLLLVMLRPLLSIQIVSAVLYMFTCCLWSITFYWGCKLRIIMKASLLIILTTFLVTFSKYLSYFLPLHLHVFMIIQLLRAVISAASLWHSVEINSHTYQIDLKKTTISKLLQVAPKFELIQLNYIVTSNEQPALLWTCYFRVSKM